MKSHLLFVNIIIMPCKKVLSSFNKLLLPLNNLLRLKSRRKNNVKNKLNDKNTEIDPKSNVEWSVHGEGQSKEWFVDITQDIE